MQRWIVKHLTRDLFLDQNVDYQSLRTPVVCPHNPWYSTDEVPTLFLTAEEAEEARVTMDVPSDWKVVEVEITEK